MAEAQEVVDKLRDVLLAQDQSATPELRDLAVGYADLCRTVNDRIRRCSQLLRQNLRTEAVHLAEASPNVLDQLTILDFPGRNDWRQLCVQYGLPEAPVLDIDSAAAINDAYTAVQPIAVLLAKHRTLAMALAPLPLRLVVMREIARLDTTASFWVDDIRTFEVARLGEIRKILTSASVDPQLLENLQSELNSNLWSVPVPADMTRDVNARVEKFRDEESQRDMQKLLPELDAAYSAMEEDRCRALLEDCGVALQGRSPNGDIRERLEAVQTWLHGLEQSRKLQRDFDAACVQLEQAIDTGKPTETIEQAYKATTRLSLPLAPELETRYKQCMARRQQEALRKRKMIYFTVAAAAVVLLAAIGLFAFFTIRSHEVRGWDQVIRAATAEVTRMGDLADGQKVLGLLAKQPAGVRDTPKIIADTGKLQAAVAAEQIRAKHFKSLYARAVPLPLGSAQALRLMSAARAVALRPSEKAAIRKWFRKHHAYDQQQQALRNSAFNRAARKLLDRIDLRLTAGDIRHNPAMAVKTLQLLEAQLKGLETTQGITKKLYDAEIDSIQAVLSRRSAALTNIIADNAAYARILTPPFTVGDYISALKSYKNGHPDGRYKQTVAELSAAIPALRAVKAWSDLRTSWAGSLLNPTRENAKVYLAAITKYLAAYPNSPLAEVALQYSNYLAQALTATAATGPWLGQFSTVLHNRLLRRLDIFTTSGGTIYFVLPGTRITQNTIGNDQVLSFNAVTSADASARSVIDLPVGVSLTTKRPVRSPQARLSRRLLDAVRGMSFGQWNTIGFEEMRLLQSSSASPVVKGLLLSDVLVLNKPFMSKKQAAAFSNSARRLKHLHLENVNWLNPAKPVQSDIVHGVDRAFKMLPDLTQYIAQAHSANEALKQSVNFSISTLGICRKVNGAMSIHCAAMPPSNGDRAWVIVAGGTKYHLEKIGVRHAGKWVWVPGADSTMVEGTLVLITPGEK